MLQEIRSAFKYSFYLTALFIVIFAISRITGLYHFIELRFINYILFFPIGFSLLKKARADYHGHLHYFQGLAISLTVVVLGQFWYAILFYFYLFADKTVLVFLSSLMPQPLFYPRLSILFVLIGEGVAAGSICSFALMQYFKWKAGRWAISA
jgi:hypothetical protein